jgi:hypothetical protein
MSEIATFAPIRVQVDFALTDGNQVATAGYHFPVGEMPTAADVEQAAAYVLKQVHEQLGEAFFFQTRHGFVSDEMAECTGGVRLAIPGPDEWTAAWAEGSSSVPA